jgi:F0F1-type ATP synthase alpha subunit
MNKKLNIEHELYKLVTGKNFEQGEDIGQVLSVKDGVATIYGLNQIKAGELIEFIDSGMKGMALNLNEDSV